jgi:hypothetical protein
MVKVRVPSDLVDGIGAGGEGEGEGGMDFFDRD